MKTISISKWAEFFQDEINSGASQSDIISHLEQFHKEQLTPDEDKDNEINELKRMLKEVRSYLGSFKLFWNEAEKMLNYKIESLISKK